MKGAQAPEGPHRGLTFVGVGPRGADGLTPAGIKAVVLAGAVFADDFTALFPPDTMEFLQKTRKEPIGRPGREGLEQGTAVLEAAEGSGGAVLLVPGDPMAATTHVSLRIEATRRGLPVELIFGPSIVSSAFSEAGLQHYKAGRTVTVPFLEKGFTPTSTVEKIEANLHEGLHTLALLDLRAHEDRFMTANEAFDVLVALSKALGRPVVTDSTLAVVVARAGEASVLREAGSVKRLRGLEFGGPMHCLIFPGPLHFEEREALKVLCKAHEAELPPEKAP